MTTKSKFEFGRPTFRNCVAFTVDGKSTFEQIYHHLSRAKTSICIANYDLDPSLRFVRRYPIDEDDDTVKSKCEKELIYTCSSENVKKYSLENLLISKAKQGLDIKIIVWQPNRLFRSLPGADDRGIDGRAEEIEILDKMEDKLHLNGELTVRVDDTSPTFTSAHHEKIIIIDNEIGFCGGLDLSRGKWDTSNHSYDSRLRDSGSEPWHDVSVVVKGPVVSDLRYHFFQRWHYSKSKDIKKIRSMEFPVVLKRIGEGQVPVTALRTWKEFERTGGIRAWYANGFKKAESSIYIENQFPFQDDFMTRILLRRLGDNKKLKVVILGPLEPNLPGLVGKILSGVSINDVNRNLARLRKAGGDRVRTYCLISETKTTPVRRRQIYIHSKLMIVDDKWITVGSANLDKNGMSDSSEVNLGVTSSHLAKALRIRLWKEHTAGIVNVTNLHDFDDGFDALDRVASANGKRVCHNKPICGHLYYYDFKERDIPVPYSKARSLKQLVLP